MGRLAVRGLALAMVIGLLGVGSYALAGGGTNTFKGKNMNGYEETPDVSTVANGSFEARLSKDGTTLSYELSYSGLEGNVTQAHIHFGRRNISGGVSIWLCQTGTNAAPVNPLDTPLCLQPGTGGVTVTGTVNASDVVGPAGQGIAAGEFAEILAAMRAGHAYVNLHSSKFPLGEIRAQLNDGGGDGDSDD